MTIKWCKPATHGLQDKPSPGENDGNEYTTKRVNKANKVGDQILSEIETLNKQQRKTELGFIEPAEPEQAHNDAQARKDRLERKIRRVAEVRQTPVPEKPSHADRLRISDTVDPERPRAFQSRTSPAKQRLHRIRSFAQEQILYNTSTVYHNVSIKDHTQVTHRLPRKLSDVIGQAFRDKAMSISDDYTDKTTANTVKETLRSDDHTILRDTAQQTGINIENDDDTRLESLYKTLIRVETKPARDILTDEPTEEERIAISEQTLHDDYPAEPSVMADQRHAYFKQTLTSTERQRYAAQGQWLPRTARPPQASRNTASDHQATYSQRREPLPDRADVKQHFQEYQDSHVPDSH